MSSRVIALPTAVTHTNNVIWRWRWRWQWRWQWRLDTEWYTSSLRIAAGTITCLIIRSSQSTETSSSRFAVNRVSSWDRDKDRQFCSVSRWQSINALIQPRVSFRL
jgi:hypothetical protein